MASGRVQAEPGHESVGGGGHRAREEEGIRQLDQERSQGAERPRDHIAKMAGYYKKEKLGLG